MEIIDTVVNIASKVYGLVLEDMSYNISNIRMAFTARHELWQICRIFFLFYAVASYEILPLLGRFISRVLIKNYKELWVYQPESEHHHTKLSMWASFLKFEKVARLFCE